MSSSDAKNKTGYIYATTTTEEISEGFGDIIGNLSGAERERFQEIRTQQKLGRATAARDTQAMEIRAAYDQVIAERG